MALTYNQLSGITQNKFLPKLYDNIFLGNPILKRAKDKGWYKKVSGGMKILVPLEYDELSAAGWYQGAETLDTTDNETFTAAEYDWKQSYVNISITRRDELKNSGDSQIVDFVKAKVKNAEKTMKKILVEGFYNDGSDAKAVVGMRKHISTSNTVGGISQTDNSWWAAQVDSSTTTLTISAMQTLFNDCSEDNEQPSLIVGDKSMYNRYYGILQPQQRFVDTEMAKGGFQTIMFNGQVFVCDTNSPSGYLWMFNESHLHYLVHEEEDMRFEPFAKPVNQNVKTAKIYWMGALGSSNNRFHGALTAITA